MTKAVSVFVSKEDSAAILEKQHFFSCLHSVAELKQNVQSAEPFFDLLMETKITTSRNLHSLITTTLVMNLHYVSDKKLLI